MSFVVCFNKVAGPQNCNFIEKRLQHRFFTVNFVNYAGRLVDDL